MHDAPPLVRTRLSVMMFLQYAIWSAWFPLVGYMPAALGFTGTQSAWVMLNTAIGAMIAPLFVGLVADRFFPAQWVLAALHLACGVCLLLAPQFTTFWPLFVVMVLYGACYMPTLALTNSIAFCNIPNQERDFPWVRVWGTIGWWVTATAIGIFLEPTNPAFMYLAGGAAILMAVYSLSLPHTPPKSGEEVNRDPLGLRALGMLREPSFAVFAFCSLLVCIVLSTYWVGAFPFLIETDRPAPAALMGLGQFSEIFFMFAMPWFLAVLGLKRTIIIGILAWVVRYAFFATPSFPLVLIGLLIHGICYDFFFVSAYIYVDKKAPADLRSSAQSLITFIMLGVGMFIGMQLGGVLIDAYPSQHRITATVVAVEADGTIRREVKDDQPLPEWPTTQRYTGALRYLDVAGTLRGYFEKEEERKEPVRSLAQQLGSDEENAIALETLRAWPEERLVVPLEKDEHGNVIRRIEYGKDDLVAAFERVDQEAGDGDGVVTRAEWRAAQAHRWPQIWMWPLALALVTAVIFAVGFRDNAQAEPLPLADDAPLPPGDLKPLPPGAEPPN